MFQYLSVIFLLFQWSHAFVNRTNLQNYGPYQYEFDKHETCKGPKKTDCGPVKIMSLKNMSEIPISLNFPVNCPVTKAKITIGVMENNKTKTLWNYQLNQPCNHFAMGPLMVKLFNSTRNCVILKGHYNITINMDDMMERFLGPSFFYDSYFFKSVAYSNNNNFFCTFSVVKLFKL